MNPCPFQRARSPQQKAERQAQILEAAAGFFQSQRFEDISLADIARQAGVSKAALYRYFPSKEALFLGLYLKQLEALVKAPLASDLPLWQAMTRQLMAHPLFCRLTAILHSVLEQNLDASQARAFKVELLKHFSTLAQRLQTEKGLSAEQALRYLMQTQQSLIGCWAVSHPAPVVAELQEQPPFNLFLVDFESALGAQLQALEQAL